LRHCVTHHHRIVWVASIYQSVKNTRSFANDRPNKKKPSDDQRICSRRLMAAPIKNASTSVAIV
jgi:hypothetical protein